MTPFYVGFITGVLLGPCLLVLCLGFWAYLTRWKV